MFFYRLYICLSVCLSDGLSYLKSCEGISGEFFGGVWDNQMIRFWWRFGSQSGILDIHVFLKVYIPNYFILL